MIKKSPNVSSLFSFQLICKSFSCWECSCSPSFPVELNWQSKRLVVINLSSSLAVSAIFSASAEKVSRIGALRPCRGWGSSLECSCTWLKRRFSSSAQMKYLWSRLLQQGEFSGLENTSLFVPSTFPAFTSIIFLKGHDFRRICSESRGEGSVVLLTSTDLRRTLCSLCWLQRTAEQRWVVASRG